MEHTAVDDALAAITLQRQNHPLSITSLVEPIVSDQTSATPQQDASHGDTSLSQTTSLSQEGIGRQPDAHLTPAALSADLAHYQSLFSKLRFSYLEQVTKEKYLRSIVGDPPVLVTHDDNLALEERLLRAKGDLKTKKEGVNALVQEMEVFATQLAAMHERVEHGVQEMQRLPAANADLQRQVDELRAQLKLQEDRADPEMSDDPRMHLNLDETMRAVEEQRQKAQAVQDQIDALQTDLPAKVRECDRTERELEELDTRRNEVTRSAQELRRRREEGGRDVLEEQGRWFQASETVLRGLLGEA